MPLKDLLKKKDKVQDAKPLPTQHEAASDFTFMRTDTNTQQIFDPPTLGGVAPSNPPPTTEEASPGKRKSRLRAFSSASTSSVGKTEKSERRLSERLHFRSHSRTTSSGSVNLPSDLPNISDGTANPTDDETQANWEKRATLLAKTNPTGKQIVAQEAACPKSRGGTGLGQRSRSRSPSVSDPGGDTNIQEAIRLHEAGDLKRSTEMFGRLADPTGANNALSQVLYGLALRHGWGCEPNPAKAVTYLSAAASNSATIEELALNAGMKKGGAAKGELVLAIFELANCFRNGWGVDKDSVAAKMYYETAANLGDTDAMNEVAGCYERGDGTKKDKVRSPFFFNHSIP
ncbi:MAG: hypothetical protein M1814_004022 [Vezdaea aestivalis]|nr:MAG: hypothetical protein M1814_004022 [Vezdaea aestivalis]